jgi:hypothetical protein
MARDNRNIVRAIRDGDKRYKSGQEDEVAKRYSKADIARFVKNGSLEGDWGIKEASDEDATDTESKAADALRRPARGKSKAADDSQGDEDAQDNDGTPGADS